MTIIVSKKHKKLVLELDRPEQVTTVIPTARTLTLNGKTLVAVPHRPSETRVLRNLGFEVPPPIEWHYDWSGQYQPFDAQRETAGFLVLNGRAFVLSEVGTGKTNATLWAYDYLRSVGDVRKMLVVSPLSTLERAWGDEIVTNFPHLTYTVLYGTREQRVRLLSQDVDIYIINHDGINVLQNELLKRPDIDVVVIDEIATFRNAKTARWRTLKKIIAGRSRVWGLTGTPTPNSPVDAWAQCRLISPDRVPPSYLAFRDLTMRQLTKFTWAPRSNADEIVAQAMQPAIRFTRDQCLDLPPCINVTREVELSADQKVAYKTMMERLRIELEEGTITAVNEAVKIGKLVQILAGCAYDENGNELAVSAKPRVDVTREIIEEAGAKAIVFVPYKGALAHLADELRKDFSVAVINGDVPKKERNEIFRNFQLAADPRVLVAQPAAMAHGLTLTAANTIVWFAPVLSNEIYQQACGRIVRPGQRRSQLIVNIEGSSLERRLYARLQKNQQFQGLVLELIKEGGAID